MKVSWKRAFYVGGFLALLCGGLGLIIAGGDMITRDRIAQNEIEKEKSGLSKVFGSGCDYGEATSINDESWPTLKKFWTVKDGEKILGRVYAASGTNAYGDVSLLVGINADYSLGQISVLKNTESYATTLEDGYLIPYQQAEDKASIVTQVNCGATYGAKMCRDMILSAKTHYQEANYGEK